MRTHSEIVDASWEKIRQLFPELSATTIRSWKQRDSIPGERWKILADARVASLTELSSYAAKDIA